VREETIDLELSLQPESQRNFAPSSIATSARNMGVSILHTTQKIAVSMKKTERKNRFLRRQEQRKDIQSCKLFFCAVEVGEIEKA
jgi:hypothetical protein